MNNYGFKPDILQPDHYVLGASPLKPEVLLEDGDWTEVLPDWEPQSKNFETFNCTGFATVNCYEMLMRLKFDLPAEFSDRFVGICAGTYPSGNSPHVVAESIRKNGLVQEFMLPFSDDLQNIEEYYSFKGADESKARAAGKDWLKQYTPGHEWVYAPTNGLSLPIEQRQELMVEALKSSPLGVSVSAWPAPDENGIYHKPMGSQDNHWTCAVVAVVRGKYWIIYDSYLADGKPFKNLAWDYDFTFCKRYTITKNLVPSKKSLWASFKELFLSILFKS